jgi:hypothetical protein
VYKEAYLQIMRLDSRHEIKSNSKALLPVEWFNSLIGNSGQYYASIWSRVLSADLFDAKIKNNSMNNNYEAIGRDIKTNIFMNGGTIDAYDQICNYIGKKPAVDGFLAVHELDTDIEYSFYLKSEKINKEKYVVKQNKNHHKTHSTSNVSSVSNGHHTNNSSSTDKSSDKYSTDTFEKLYKNGKLKLSDKSSGGGSDTDGDLDTDNKVNYFSEIYESAIDVDEIENQTEDMDYIYRKNRF